MLFTWKNFTWKKTFCPRKWWEGWRHPTPSPFLYGFVPTWKKYSHFKQFWDNIKLQVCDTVCFKMSCNVRMIALIVRLSKERVWWRALPKKLTTRLTYFILAFSNFSFKNYGGELGFILKLITKSWYFL